MASGLYIMRLDADDWLVPEAVEKLVSALEKNTGAGLVFGDYFEVDEEGLLISRVERHDFNTLNILDMPAHGACTLFRTECLKKLGGYDKEFDRQDGYEIWLRFIQLFGVINVKEPLFHYRRHQLSLTSDETKLLATRSQILAKHGLQKKDERYNENIILIPISTEYGIGARCLDLLGSKELLCWTIDEALNSQRTSSVIVSCSDETVISFVRAKYPNTVEVIARQKILSNARADLFSVAQDSVKHLPDTVKNSSAVAVLTIENPFRRAEQIDNLFDVLDIFNADSVIAVRREDQVLMNHSMDGLKLMREFVTVRNERDDVYRKAGGMQAIKISCIQEGVSFYDGMTAHYLVDEMADFDVRSKIKWLMAESFVTATDFAEDIQC